MLYNKHNCYKDIMEMVNTIAILNYKKQKINASAMQKCKQ